MSDTAPELELMKQQIRETTPKSIDKKEVQKQEEEKKKEADPRDNKFYTFELDYTDRRKRHWKGAFTTRILNIKDTLDVGIMKAKLLGGAASQSVDIVTDMYLEQIAHLTFSLEDSPEWAKDLMGLDDIEVVDAIYKEVIGHSDHYFRLEKYKKKGQEESGDSGK